MCAAVETGEMVESEGFAADREPGFGVTRQMACAQVPRRHVVAPAADDSYSFEKGRNKINPALIREQAIRDVIAAEVIGATRPPIGEPTPFVGSPDADESEIVDAVPKAADLIINHRL